MEGCLNSRLGLQIVLNWVIWLVGFFAGVLKPTSGPGCGWRGLGPGWLVPMGWGPSCLLIVWGGGNFTNSGLVMGLVLVGRVGNVDVLVLVRRVGVVGGLSAVLSRQGAQLDVPPYTGLALAWDNSGLVPGLVLVGRDGNVGGLVLVRCVGVFKYVKL